MNNKEDILKKMLFELDSICRKHEVRYYLLDPQIDYIIKHESLPPNFTDITVAMTIGDIEKIMDDVNCSENRRIECFANNYQARNFEIRYYNMNSTCINVYDFRNHIYHGIFIRILELQKKPRGADKKKLALLNKICRGVNINNYSFRNIKNIVLSIFLKIIVFIIGKEKFHKKAYECKKKYTGISSWENEESLIQIRSIFIDERKIFVSEKEMQGNFKGYHDIQYQEKYEIINTCRSYKDIMTKEVVSSLNSIAKKIDKYTAQQWKNAKVKKEIKDAWNTYLMSRELVMCNDKR